MALPLFAVLDTKRGLLDATLGRETLIISAIPLHHPDDRIAG